MIRPVAFMIAFFENLCRMTMPILQTGIPAFIPTIKSGLARISQPSDHCMHRSQPFILFQCYFFLFFCIHSVVSLFLESNFLSAPPGDWILVSLLARDLPAQVSPALDFLVQASPAQALARFWM